jgi:hypothetical protein
MEDMFMIWAKTWAKPKALLPRIKARSMLRFGNHEPLCGACIGLCSTHDSLRETCSERSPNHELASQRLPPKGIDRKKKHCKVEMYEAQKV